MLSPPQPPPPLFPLVGQIGLAAIGLNGKTADKKRDERAAITVLPFLFSASANVSLLFLWK